MQPWWRTGWEKLVSWDAGTWYAMSAEKVVHLIKYF
jgi:hypothetical protein